ncbi:MAG: Lrp/AsnC family transcriptional regulator [Oceanospirillaceae bacterium]|nr:Lrp/AsnC family transcriptional regulator [Oceanospirillaceae bacterium]
MLNTAQQHALRLLIQEGLPLVSRPYASLAEQIGSDEQSVRETLQNWQDSKLIKRFGLVLNHHKLGYVANAMVVWNVPDHLVECVAAQLINFSGVTLCYQRPRRLPEWRFNLFCMIHGKNRADVLAYIDGIVQQEKLQHIERKVLFSTFQYKQRGGRYAVASAGAA